jgi:hypothetical protein
MRAGKKVPIPGLAHELFRKVLNRLRKNSTKEHCNKGTALADKVSRMSRTSAPADPSFAKFAFRSDFFPSL